MDKDLQAQLQTPLELTKNARQRALEFASHKVITMVFGQGCLWTLATSVAVIFLIILFSRNSNVLNYLYGFVMSGIPIIFIGSVIFAVKKAPTTKNPALETYRIYQQNWVNQLLSAFFKHQYKNMSVYTKHLGGVLMHDIEKPQLYLFDKQHYKEARNWASVTYSGLGINIEADFCTWKKSENKLLCPSFKGVIYKIPYQQIYPDKITYILSRHSKMAVAKKLLPLSPDENTAPVEFWVHFKVYSNDDLHFQVLASNELIAYLLKLQQQGYPFIAVTATANQLYLWLDLQKELCCPSLQTALPDTINEAEWDGVVAIMPELAEIAKNRANLNEK